jgi:hypothetical protein
LSGTLPGPRQLLLQISDKKLKACIKFRTVEEFRRMTFRVCLACCLPIFLVLFAIDGAFGAALTGPTLQLDYGRGRALENPTAKFMYFVPLISPEPVFVVTNAGSTHCTRVTSSVCRVSGGTFLATCEFEFGGRGFLRNVLDHTELIRTHEKELRAGVWLRKQLGSIDVEGQGSGKIEIEGTVTNGLRSVNEVRLRFNNHGNPSPVSISLQDIGYHDGAVHFENEIIVKVNMLIFRRTSAAPAMLLTVASVKPKEAGDTTWQNFVGHVKGIIANEVIPPIPVDATGHQAMLDFGRALAEEDPTFTFPFAERLKNAP